uniref:R3H domain-containing protein n=1 Tax=Timema douglasi TaxID=61478 RepID=A0A7R8ZAG7_TIMDO|nr:unnamed protein product [Timema douglasi]
MERGVFSAVPVKLGLRIKMEALVQDLTAALEESSRSSTVRRRWGLRRRARSTGNLPLACHRTQSDDSSSSIGELMISRDRGMSSLHQSDSDDIAIAGGIRHHLTPFSLRSRQVPHLHGNFESDSFNENFSPIHLNTRRYRKRKFKRMAVDPVDSNNPSTSQASAPPPVLLASSKKKHLIRHLPNCENRFNNLMCGKRKRSAREQGMDCDRPGASRGKGTRTDDEQSDWFGGDSSGRGGWWEEGDGGDSSRPQSALAMEDTDSEEVGDPAFKAILAGSFEHLSEEAKQAYRAHMMWVREGLSGREIRAGRRRIRGETPGFSIMTSANEKLSRFLQDPDQSELRLHPMQRMEREQLHQLANLYSLNMTSDPGRKGLTCPVLTKTSP